MKTLFRFVLLSLASAAISTLAAAPDNDLEVVKLKNGFNEIHLDGVDYRTVAVVSHRENYNAHSYDVTTLYVDYKPNSQYESNALLIIPIFEKNQDNTLTLETGGGADCALNDFRLVDNTKTHEVSLIVAKRGFGQSYVDSEVVEFTYYKLKFDNEGIAGFPPFYFEYWKAENTKQKYCDVEEAFKKELGLEEYRTDIKED